MQKVFPKPKKESVIYEDNKLYVCLAHHAIAMGHTVIVWKNKVKDLNKLSKKDYEYLMVKVDEIRNALITSLKVEKVYLIYMDEAKHVHWHLIPRYNKKGYNLLKHKPVEVKDFSMAKNISKNINSLK